MGRLELLEVVREAYVADVVVVDLRDARLVQVCVDRLAAEDRRGAAELRSDLMGERMGVDSGADGQDRKGSLGGGPPAPIPRPPCTGEGHLGHLDADPGIALEELVVGSGA